MPKTIIALDWKEAKREAVRLGNQIGAEVIQGPKGEKIVLINGKRIECTTWYAAYQPSNFFKLDLDT